MGAVAGALLLRTNMLFGALVGLLIGHAFDAGWFAPARRPARDNPYKVFGLADSATDAEVDLAYRRLMTQYHPDKLAGVAEERRQQSEAKARDINAAYDRIKTMRRRR